MSGPPQPGCGRGGRGALLLAALQKQARRPGLTESSSEKQSEAGSVASSPIAGLVTQPQAAAAVPIPTVPISRGAALLKIRFQAAGQALSSQTTPSSTPTFPSGRAALIAGSRGFGRAQSLSISSTPSPASPVSTPSSLVSQGSAMPLVRKMKQLEINQLRGNDGAIVQLSVNYVRLKVEPGMGIFEYHVSFNPPIDSKNMRFHLINTPSVKDIIGPTRTFDGSKLYLPISLPENVTSVVAILPTDKTVVTLHIKLVGQCRAGDPESIQLYNLLLRRTMHKLNMTLVGKNYFDHHAGIPIPQHKLEVWPGYVTCVSEFQDGLMLNLDASFRVLRNITARDILFDLYNARRATFQEEFIKQVVGCIVITRYNNKTYRIDDVAWDMTPKSTFTNHLGIEVSFADYYKNSYDIAIVDLSQPMLLNRPRVKGVEAQSEQKEKLICLVPELCHLTGLTDEMRSDFKIMRDIAVHTRVPPQQREEILRTYIRRVKETPEASKVLSDWGLEMCEAPMSVEGRGLFSEKIIVGNNKTFVSNKEADWGREMCREHVLSAVSLQNWIVIYVRRDSVKALDFISMMKNVCPAMGMNISQPKTIELNNDRTEFYTKAAKEAVNPTVQLVVFIFPTSRDDRYSAVKKLCCVEMPVASQAINTRTISQPQKLRSVVQKIGLQINCKLGGELWAVQIPLQKTMVCGVDVYHDPSRGGRSVVGFVSSLNNTFTRWFSLASFQSPGQELADCLKMALLSGLKKFDEVNHFLPEKIIFYRDGVSDGQLQYVRDYEVPQMESCFKSLTEVYNPTLTVVVVQKRINTRLFIQQGRSLNNPPPGSILDHTVTSQAWFDFFLVSQHVRQGTVTPTHYIVVYNRSQLKPDHIQKLSYKLTHLYYNWPGTVRVPAPCQYAHKLAYLCGQSIHKEPSRALEDKLFFL